MPPYKLKLSTINCQACEIFHKVRKNVQMLNIDFEQEDWMLEGGCVYSDTELFFPVGSSMKAMKQANEAKDSRYLFASAFEIPKVSAIELAICDFVNAAIRASCYKQLLNNPVSSNIVF